MLGPLSSLARPTMVWRHSRALYRNVWPFEVFGWTCHSVRMLQFTLRRVLECLLAAHGRTM